MVSRRGAIYRALVIAFGVVGRGGVGVCAALSLGAINRAPTTTGIVIDLRGMTIICRDNIHIAFDAL